MARFEAHAEIVTGRDTPPFANVHAFYALQVPQNLEPTLQMPHG